MKKIQIKSFVFKLNKIILLFFYIIYLYRWYDVYRLYFKYELNYTNGSLGLREIFHFLMLIACIGVFFMKYIKRRYIISLISGMAFVCFTTITFLPLVLRIGITYDKINTIILTVSAFLCFSKLIFSNWRLFLIPSSKL